MSTLPVPGFQCGLPLLRRSGSDCSDRAGRHSSGAGVLGPGWRCEGVGTEGKSVESWGKHQNFGERWMENGSWSDLNLWKHREPWETLYFFEAFKAGGDGKWVYPSTCWNLGSDTWQNLAIVAGGLTLYILYVYISPLCPLYHLSSQFF